MSDERIIFRYLLGTAVEKILTTAAVIAATYLTTWGLSALVEYMSGMMGFGGVILVYVAMLAFSAWCVWFDSKNSIELNGDDKK